MKPIKIPEHYNYIEAYLTYDCNMSCDYCLNRFQALTCPRPLTTRNWIRALARIFPSADLPITLGGGEPTQYPGFYDVVDSIPNGTVDLLTNGTFDCQEFMNRIDPAKFRKNEKYASIRVSLHPTTSIKLVMNNIINLKKNGYSVGMWSTDHPEMTTLMLRVKDICSDYEIDFRVKEFLGYYKGKLYGRYKYPNAIGQSYTSTVQCKASELLIAPDGKVFRCHGDLYEYRSPIGDMLGDVNFHEFLECPEYGKCHPCDVKLKYDRHQVYGHCPVEIKKSM